MALPREDVQRYVFLGTIASFGVLSFLLLLPYIYYVIGAAALVYVSWPAYKRIEGWLGNDTVSALVMLLLLLIITVIPMFMLADNIIQQGQDAFRSVGTETAELVDARSIDQRVAEIVGQDVNLDQRVVSAFVQASQALSKGLPGLITTILDVVVGLFIMGAAMFYLFRDGEELLQNWKRAIPLDTEVKDELFQEGDRMLEGILVGMLLTATIQGVIVGLGMWFVGLPNVLFWTFIMIILGIIPVVGNFLVWGPAGLYLIFIEAQLLAGVGLLVYSLVSTLVADNIIRIKVVGGRAHIHPFLVMIGVIGGIPLFGFFGVVLGPLVLGLFVVLVRAFRVEMNTAAV